MKLGREADDEAIMSNIYCWACNNEEDERNFRKRNNSNDSNLGSIFFRVLQNTTSLKSPNCDFHQEDSKEDDSMVLVSLT